MKYYNVDENGDITNLIGSVKNEYSGAIGLQEPTFIPSREYTETTAEDLYKVWKFKYWALKDDETNTEVKHNEIAALKDMEFKAVYEEISVYDNVFDEKYFNFNEVTIDGIEGYTISYNDDYSLSGKVTLPTTYNDKPILAIGGFGKTLDSGQAIKHTITHIFWARNNRALKRINQNAFINVVTLKYYEQ